VIIPVYDPIEHVISYGENVFDKDLFFSKHVAMLTLFIVPEERPVIKKLMIVIVLIVAGLILLQRVHYTIDGIAVSLIMFGVFKFTKMNFLIREKN